MLVFQLQSQEGIKGQENKKNQFPDQKCEISHFFSEITKNLALHRMVQLQDTNTALEDNYCSCVFI